MYVPNPILLGVTPPGGLTLEVTAERGGLAGYVLLGQLGPPATVEVSLNDGLHFVPLSYPHTLEAGEQVRLTRTDPDGLLTTLRALAPVEEDAVPPPPPAPYAVATDPDGYQTLTNASATTDAQGYQTIPDAAATPDADGYESVEREGV